MTPTEKQYVEKLKEYIIYLIKALRLNKIMWDITIGPRGNYELQIASLKRQIEAEEKTVSDEEILKVLNNNIKIEYKEHWVHEELHHYPYIIGFDRAVIELRDKLLNN
jgi:hypothetical protein